MREFASEKDKNKIILKKIIFDLFVKWNKKKHMHTTNRRPNYSSIMETSNKIQTAGNKKRELVEKSARTRSKEASFLAAPFKKKIRRRGGAEFLRVPRKARAFWVKNKRNTSFDASVDQQLIDRIIAR